VRQGVRQILSDRPAHGSLTGRGLQICCLLATGKTVSEIAAVLALSMKTTSTHRTRILARMKLRNNAELMHGFVRNGLDWSRPAGHRRGVPG
jgi:DNA-binding CsgD family transcriptional regulator